MDDRRLCGSLVTPAPPSENPERPFGLRALIFTLGFLVFVLGVLPSSFHLLGKLPLEGWTWSTDVPMFWHGFRQLVGIAVFSGGLWVYAACSAWLIFFGRGPHVEFDPPKVFVASGPYRWMRNPVAASLIVTVLGEAIYFGSFGMLGLVLVGMPLAHWQVTHVEEPRLRQRFGESYDQYCRTVPRWIPRPPQDGVGGSSR